MNKPTILKAYIVVLFILFCFNVNSQSIKTSQKEDKNSIDFTILYHKSKTTVPDNKIHLKDFKTLPKSNSFGTKNGEYWFQLTINKSIKNKKLIAYLPVHNIGEIAIYKVINAKLEYLLSTGNNISKEQLPIDYKFPAFKINTDKNRVLYLKVNFRKEANFPLKIIPEKEFFSYVSNKQIINSFYYGTCIVIILLNIFYYIKFRDTSYLYYLLFLFSLMITFLLFDGSLINLFRGNLFYYNLEFLTHFSNEIWFLLFSIKFLDLNKKHPKITKLFFIFPLLVLIHYIFYFSTNNFIFSAIGDFIGISLFPILWFFGFYYIRKIPHAKFYVLGYFLIVPFAVFFIIGFPFGFWEVHGEMLIIKISSWLDLIVFTYALSLKKESNKGAFTIQNSIKNTSKVINSQKPVSVNNPYLPLLKDNTYTSTPLTLRELDILKTICDGHSNNQISEKLFISKNTVKYHIRNIYSKTNVKNRIELKQRIQSINN